MRVCDYTAGANENNANCDGKIASRRRFDHGAPVGVASVGAGGIHLAAKEPRGMSPTCSAMASSNFSVLLPLCMCVTTPSLKTKNVGVDLTAKRSRAK